MAKRLRKWVWGLVVAGALLLSMSIWWGYDYCPLCGKTRDVVSLNPFGARPGWWLVLSSRERETELSKVAEPLLWPDPSHHQWVRQTDTCLATELIAQGAHPRFGGQGDVYTSDPGPFFADSARADPRLVRYLLAKVLSPDADPDEVGSVRADLQWPWAPRGLEGLRAKHGLPPSNRFVSGLSLSRVGPPDALRFTMTVSNAGSEPLVVDRELVFGISIEVLSGEDVAEDAFEVIHVLPKPDKVEPADRFVRVAPGQAVSRTIDLTDRFLTFREHEAPWDWREFMVRLQPDAPHDAVRVSYDMLRNCPGEAFSRYTGLGNFDRANIGLLPLAAEARLDF